MTRPASSVAEAFIELLLQRGVRFLFGNGGTDFGPIIEAYAQRERQGLPVLEPITVPHEIPAVAMAHGVTLVTGQPQVVMVHTIAGTANTIGNLINASRSHVPMLLCAGRNPLTEGDLPGARNMSIHWAQESIDQGAMVREWVKWDYELRHGADLESIVDRALAIAATEPKGPVYLTLPREILAEPASTEAPAERARIMPALSIAAPESLSQAASALASAGNPVAVTRSLGRDPAAVEQLVAMADALGMPVFEAPPTTHVNFPAGHPLFMDMPADEALADADVVLVLECDVPWNRPERGPQPEATVIGVGVDPLFSKYPVRGFPVDIALSGSVAHNLAELNQQLDTAPVHREAAARRRERWAERHQECRLEIDRQARAGEAAKRIDKAWLTRCVEDLRDADTVIVNELGFDMSQFEFERPGDFFGVSVAGVLGWALGAALGVKLAAPERTVIACMGDGCYLFGAPTATHWVAARYKLPVLFIVWNNARWNTVETSTRAVYPEGVAVTDNNFAFCDLSPRLELEQVCRAAGGYGERVEDPRELPAALQRALTVVRKEGRQALLNIVA